MKILAVGNHKGGTAKTTTAHNLGAVLASDHGRRVLLVDADPQGSLTAACGVDASAGDSMAAVMGDNTPGRAALGAILREVAPGLWLAPADMALAVSELGLAARAGRENVLRRALGTVAARFDLAVIDCPPGLGLLTVNGLVAADAVLIPVQPQGADLRALALFLGTVERARALNPGLAVLGVLVTFYDGRLTHHRDAIEAMTGAGLPVLAVTVGRSVRVAEATAAGQAVTVYAPHNPQARAYRALAREVDRWLTESDPT